MRRRVVITGMGVIAPLGHSVDQLFRAQIEGRSGVGPITLFNASRFPTHIAAEVKGFDLAAYVQHPERYVHSGANTRFAMAAAQQAVASSGLLDSAKLDRSRLGIYLGTGEGNQPFVRTVVDGFSHRLCISFPTSRAPTRSRCEFGMEAISRQAAFLAPTKKGSKVRQLRLRKKSRVDETSKRRANDDLRRTATPAIRCKQRARPMRVID